MNSYRKTAIAVGILLIAAYGVLASLFTDSLVIIILFEAFSGVAVIVISLLMMPILKGWNKKATIYYLIGKCLEGGLMIIAAFILLSQSAFLLEIREQIYLYHAYFLIVSSMFLYYLLYQSELVPRFISIWGVIALILLLIGNLLELMGSTSPILPVFYPWIMVNEIFLAGWFIFKGFNVVEKSIENNKSRG